MKMLQISSSYVANSRAGIKRIPWVQDEWEYVEIIFKSTDSEKGMCPA